MRTQQHSTDAHTFAHFEGLVCSYILYTHTHIHMYTHNICTYIQTLTLFTLFEGLHLTAGFHPRAMPSKWRRFLLCRAPCRSPQRAPVVAPCRESHQPEKAGRAKLVAGFQSRTPSGSFQPLLPPPIYTRATAYKCQNVGIDCVTSAAATVAWHRRAGQRSSPKAPLALRLTERSMRFHLVGMQTAGRACLRMRAMRCTHSPPRSPAGLACPAFSPASPQPRPPRPHAHAQKYGDRLCNFRRGHGGVAPAGRVSDHPQRRLLH